MAGKNKDFYFPFKEWYILAKKELTHHTGVHLMNPHSHLRNHTWGLQKRKHHWNTWTHHYHMRSDEGGGHTDPWMRETLWYSQQLSVPPSWGMVLLQIRPKKIQDWQESLVSVKWGAWWDMWFMMRTKIIQTSHEIPLPYQQNIYNMCKVYTYQGPYSQRTLTRKNLRTVSRTYTRYLSCWYSRWEKSVYISRTFMQASELL